MLRFHFTHHQTSLKKLHCKKTILIWYDIDNIVIRYQNINMYRYGGKKGISTLQLYNKNFKVWSYGNTLEGKFRIPSPYLSSFMAIGLVWHHKQCDEVWCLWKTCGYCSIVWVRNDGKNNLPDVKTIIYKQLICISNISALPENRWYNWLAKRRASEVCIHAKNDSCHLWMGKMEPCM